MAKTGNHGWPASHYGRVVEIDPRHVAAQLAQVVALSRAGRHQEAYQRLKEARAVLPESIALTHAMARLLAACPDETLRDGEQALELALSVFKIRNSPQHADTVAMAYAELGNFEEAIRWQTEIVQGAEKAGRDDLLPRARKNLALYRDRNACRDPGPPMGATIRRLLASSHKQNILEFSTGIRTVGSWRLRLSAVPSKRTSRPSGFSPRVSRLAQAVLAVDERERLVRWSATRESGGVARRERSEGRD